MPKYAARVDANQARIVAALRAAGATVQVLSAVGQGCPDLLVGRHGVNYLLECKVEHGKLTPDEATWHDLWRGDVAIVRDEDDALRVVGAA